MLRIIHTADIHLDSPLAGLAAKAGDRANDLVGATRRAFTAMIDYAIREAVDLVLIAGDLYDGDWKDFSTGLFFAAEMARLERAGIRVMIIKGNHDAENLMTRSLTCPRNVRIFEHRKPETYILEDLGVAVHGQSFPKRDVTDNLAHAYPEPVAGLLNIGMLHTAADGGYGHTPYAPCSVQDLAGKGYDYWALGHVHKRTVLSEDPWIVFPGNLQGRHANEVGNKGFTLITADAQSIASVEHVPIDVVRWAQVRADVNDCADLETVLDRIREQLTHALDEADGRTLAVRLTIEGKTAAHRRIAGNIAQMHAECTSLLDQCGGDIWLEKVVIGTAEPNAPAAASADAFAELFRTIQELEADPALTAALAAEFRSGLDRMPPKARELAGLAEFDDDQLAAVLEGAGATLRHYLFDAR